MLWLSKGLGPGGAERLLVSLARSIDRERFELHAAYLLPEKEHLVPALEAAGIPAVCLSGGHPWQVTWLGRLRQLVHHRGIDVVHIHSPVAAAMARPILRVQGGHRPTIIYTEHNSWDGYRLTTRTANAATWPLDDYRLAVSRTALESVPRVMRSRTEVLVHGIELDAVTSRLSQRRRVRAELGATDDELLVVTVANLREHKDYPTMLNAARHVIDSGAPIRFAAVGQGPLEGPVRSEIARLGIGDRFQLLGYREDAIDVIAAGDVFTLSSLAEGYPVSVMEALALGRPVVATAVGGIPDAVRDGIEGVLVPPASAGALADALVAIAQDRHRLVRMGTASAERALLFDIRRAARRHEEIYDAFAHGRYRKDTAKALRDSRT